MFVALPSDAPNHAELGRGLAESNAEGGLLRFLAQFRSYGAPVVKLLGGRDAKSERAPSDDRILGFANAVVWLVVLERLQSFASAAAQGQALKGKDVVWFDSASNSGALGLCADFLFAEITGMNLVPISALATLRHPAIAPALAVWHRARNAEDARAALATWAEKQGHEDGDAPDRLRVLQRGLNAGLRHLLQKAAD
jgi:hypothetical protein